MIHLLQSQQASAEKPSCKEPHCDYTGVVIVTKLNLSGVNTQSGTWSN